MIVEKGIPKNKVPRRSARAAKAKGLKRKQRRAAGLPDEESTGEEDDDEDDITASGNHPPVVTEARELLPLPARPPRNDSWRMGLVARVKLEDCRSTWHLLLNRKKGDRYD